MADDVEEEEDEGGGGLKNKIIMVVALLAIGGGVYNFVLKPEPTPEELAMMEEQAALEAQQAEEEAAKEAEAAENAIGDIVELEEMILNIGGERDGFLKVTVAVVLTEGTLLADFEPKVAVAKDVTVHYLSSLTQEQLRTVQGRNAAKAELTARIQEAYAEVGLDGMVNRVLFIDLVMQ
jgi:flagellar basal body-associated protein FliL